MFPTVFVASRAGLTVGACYTLQSQSCCFLCNYTQSWEDAPGVFDTRVLLFAEVVQLEEDAV